MFVDAIEKARKFTLPVVISSRRSNGKCSAAIGAFVVINSDGWVVTAAHIPELADGLMQETATYQQAEAERAKIHADTSLTKKERAKKLRAVPRTTNETVTNSSEWWGYDGVSRSQTNILKVMDLAFLKMTPFPPRLVTDYPVFKNSSPTLQQGRSLCRIGFPFHSIEPVFHENRNQFELPTGSLPMPVFPNDGLFTREVQIALSPSATPPPNVPLKFLETTSPGLRGQSGGPIFDTDGFIWAIQSSTRHMPLGFSPIAPGGKKNQKEHQFLNVGWGIHVETLVAAMRQLGINFQESP